MSADAHIVDDLLDDPSLTAADIFRPADQVERLEDVDVLTLNDSELLAYVADLQAEARWLRLALHAAVHEAARLYDAYAAARRTVEQQRCKLQRYTARMCGGQ